jgi:transketolase
MTTLRLNLLELYHTAGAGHIACSLSCIDLLYHLFQRKREADRIILSKGHAAAALYVCLQHFGQLSKEQLNTFYHDGTRLSAHPSPGLHPWAPLATGSLGHGLPVGCGMALAMKKLHNNGRVYVLMSDGETNEGTTWEAAHFARQHQLGNLVVVVDKNRIQGFGKTAEVLGDTTTEAQWKSLGWHVLHTDGHDSESIEKTISLAETAGESTPCVILADTVKGKGVSFMENTIDWHYWPMSPAQYEQAVNELRQGGGYE